MAILVNKEVEMIMQSAFSTVLFYAIGGALGVTYFKPLPTPSLSKPLTDRSSAMLYSR
jgi:hypothetical protein